MKSLKKKNRRAGQSKRNENKGTTESKCRSLVPYDGNSNSVVVRKQDFAKSFLEETPVDVILAQPKPSIEMLARQIGLRWHRSLKGIFEAARIAAHADATLKPADKKTLMQQIDMKKSYFSKLVQIGRDKRLHDPEVRKALTPNVSYIYKMTLASDEDIAHVVACATKLDYEQKEKLPPFGLTSRQIPRGANRIITFLSTMTTEIARKFDADLNRLEKKYPIQVDSFSGDHIPSTYVLVRRFPRFPRPLDSTDSDLALLPARAEAAK